MSSASSGNASSNLIPAGVEDGMDNIDEDQAMKLGESNIAMDIGEGAVAATSSSKASVSWLFDELPKTAVARNYLPEYVRNFDDEDDSEDEDYDDEDYAYDYDDDFDDEDDFFNDGDEFGDLIGMEDLLYMDAIKKEMFSTGDRKSVESMTTVLNRAQTIPDAEFQRHKRFEKIMAKLAEDQKSGLLCDVILEVDGRDFPIHKNILKASSSYFSAMFTSQFNEREEKRIKIGSVTKEDFQTIVDFAYGTPIKLGLDDFERIYMAAEMLCVDDLIEECRQQLEKTWNNSVYSFDNRNNLHLEETAKILELVEIMEMKSFGDTVIKDLVRRLEANPNHDDILTMSPMVLLHLLKCSSKYDLKKENDKILFLLEWFRKSPEDRLLYLKDILGLLKIELIDRKTFESFKNEVEVLISIHSTPEDVDEIKKDFWKIDEDLASDKVNINVDVLLFFQEPFTLRGDVRIYQEDSSGKFSWFCHSYKIETEIHQCVFVEQSNHLVLLGPDSLYVVNVKNPERSLHQKKACVLNRFRDGFVACAQKTQIIIVGRSTFKKRVEPALTVNAFQYYKSKPILIPLFYFNLDNYFQMKLPFAVSVVGETFYVMTRGQSLSGLLLVHKRKLTQIYPYDGLHTYMKSVRYVNNRMILHYVDNEKVFLIDQRDSLFSGISIKLDNEDLKARATVKTKIFEEVENKDQEWIGIVKGTLVGCCRVKKTHALLVAQNNNLTLFSLENLEKFKFLKQLPKFPESCQSTKDWRLDECVVFTRPSA